MPAIKVIYSIFSGDHLLGDYQDLATSPKALERLLKKKGIRVYAFVNPKSKKELFDGQTDKKAVAAAKKYLSL